MILIWLVLSCALYAQKTVVLDPGHGESIRVLSVVDSLKRT